MTGLDATVAAAQEGARLDVVVAAAAGISRSAAARWLDAVGARVDGEPARRSQTLHAGQRVVVPPAPATAPPTPPPLPPVRYRDEHLAVVAKPAGVVVHPGAGHHGDTLVDALAAAGVPLAPAGGPVRPGVVHRLDRDTSGLLVVACTDAAHDGLVAALRRREVTRRYETLLAGELPAPTGTVDAPIGRDPEVRTRFACVADGKPARTHWEVGSVHDLDPGTTVSRVACRLETGRTHQIRVHLAAVGCPVVGDDRYGATGSLAARLGVPRVFLHAAELGFDHPVTGRRIALVEPLPADLTAVVGRLSPPRGTTSRS